MLETNTVAAEREQKHLYFLLRIIYTKYIRIRNNRENSTVCSTIQNYSTNFDDILVGYSRSRKLQWVVHVRRAQRNLVGNLLLKVTLRNGMITLRWVLGKWVVKTGGGRN
jgi:hypothetical protein